MNSKIIYGVTSLAALLLCACTGSGGSGAAANYNTLLSGSYQNHQIGDTSAGSVLETARVDLTADGAGAGTMNIVAGNHSAGISGSGTFSYTVAADRTFSVTTPTGTVQGIASANGSTFILTDTSRTVSTAPPGDAGVVLAVSMKKSSGLTNAALNGSYQIHQAGEATPGAGLYTTRVDMTADGFGAGTWNILSHSAGSAGSGIFSYVVAADGTFSVTTKNATGLTTIGTDYGIVSADGSLFIITDTNSTASAGPPVEEAEIILAVGVKKSSGMTNASMNGGYQVHQVGKGASGMYTSRVDLTADGAGNGTWSIAANSAGGAGTHGIFTYTVAADGTFSVTTKDATGTVTIGTDYGIISADGSLFALTDTSPVASAGPPVEDAEIVMAVGMKK